MVLAENVLLLGLGLGAGVDRGRRGHPARPARARGGVPLAPVAALVLAVAATGLLVSWLAVAVIARLPLVASLRSE